LKVIKRKKPNWKGKKNVKTKEKCEKKKQKSR
jgi:hypothetical protein